MSGHVTVCIYIHVKKFTHAILPFHVNSCMFTDVVSLEKLACIQSYFINLFNFPKWLLW